MALADLFTAYYSCRRTKRYTVNAQKFEVDYEQNLLELWQEIHDGSYRPGKSIAFVVDEPVKREIFAADFRDRVVHHLIINKLNPLFEKQLIYDSYACRQDKGALLGVRRIERFIRQCSHNYTRDCYVLKLDIQGFFMHINRDILWAKIVSLTNQNYHQPDKTLLLELCQKVLYNDPTTNCTIKGRRSNWAGLPRNKSLFYSPIGCGLPIGNLTSQVFANVYMNTFDHFMKHDLQLRYYGRYVDDFIIVHQDKEYLKSLVPIIADFLKTELQLTLHPKKIHLQHYKKGVLFLGVFIKPGRSYAGKRLKGNFYAALEVQNTIIRDHRPPTDEELARFLSSLNAYLGFLRHYQTYELRKRMVYKHLNAYWWNYVSLNADATKFYLRRRKIKNPHRRRY